ncbi:hypothetical protein AGMMS50230_08950 [Spirochaetia bacterium]|nr:hypothetical protein AGMMS50230_08950 [Spirochaetia bacterium]
MEELQSTEALDREILEDARKKAFKILKGADDTVKTSKTGWEQKLEKTLEKSRQSYAEKAAKLRNEIMARLPMDKRRIRSEKIDRFLSDTMNDFLVSLSRPDLLRILERELAPRCNAVSGGNDGNGELRYRGLTTGELTVLLEKAGFAPGVFPNPREDPLHTVPGEFPAIVIDFKQLRITASADKAAETLLLDKRAELAAVLFEDLAGMERDGDR